MPHKRKGRKIYTYRVRNRKMFSKGHPMRSALGIVLTLLLTVFAGIVGYSIAAPVIERLSAEAESPTTVPAETTSTTTMQQTETTTSASVTTSTSYTESTVETTVSTSKTIPQRFSEPVQLVYCVPEENMNDAELLNITAESLVSQGYNAMMFPLKSVGGSLLYSSGVSEAQTCGASDPARLSLEDLTQIAWTRGMSCMALFDTLNDNLYPAGFQSGAYCITEGGRWLDTAEERGGKPWISPFSESARGYLSALTQEISGAGFSRIYCSDLIFPHFRDSDIRYLGSYVKNPERRAEAISAVMSGITDSASGALYTGKYGEETTAEVVSALSPETAVSLQISPSSAAKSKEQLSAARNLAGDRPFIPWVVRGAMTESELNAVLDMLYESGYREIVVSDS